MLSVFAQAKAAVPSGCSYNHGQSSHYLAYNSAQYEISNWVNYPSSSVQIPVGAAVGDVLLTLEYFSLPDPQAHQDNPRIAGQYIALANCPAGTTETFQASGPNLGMINGLTTYGTNVSNIGYRAYYPDYLSSDPVTHSSAGTYSFLYVPAGVVKVEFVLISADWPETGSTVMFNDYMAFTTVAGWGKDLLLRYRLPSAIEFVPEPCTFLSEQNKVVNLKPINLQALDANVAVGTEAFDIQLRCHSGATSPLVRFNGVAASSNQPGILQNDPTLVDRAEGVSVLLEYKEPGGGTAHPVDLSGQTAINHLTDRGECGVSCRDWQLAMQASYIKTETTATTGKIHARVEVIVQYP